MLFGIIAVLLFLGAIGIIVACILWGLQLWAGVPIAYPKVLAIWLILGALGAFLNLVTISIHLKSAILSN